MTDHADTIPDFEQQMANVKIITRLWLHYFVEDHPGDFKDCDDPGCAQYREEVKPSLARAALLNLGEHP